jgi:hypothetical protein
MGVRNNCAGMALLLALAAGPVAAAEANPEDGKLNEGSYQNPYFGLTIPLPTGWSEGLDPAGPSYDGYYVLRTPQGPDKSSPALLFAAQDMFFSFRPMENSMEAAADLRRGSADVEGIKADTPPAEVTIAGHSFARLATGGKVLSTLTLSTDIRCHIVTISISSPDPAQLESLAASIGAKISMPPEASATTDGSDKTGTAAPVCIKGYATEQTILHRVQPPLAAQRPRKIPVRIIIGTDGKVKHVHVINASEGDRKLIEETVIQWEFKPPEVNGRAVEVETGIAF